MKSENTVFFIVIAVIIVFIGGQTCISCRTVEQSNLFEDSTSVAVHSYIRDSSSTEDLQRLIRQFRQNITFTFSDIHLTRDSAGNCEQHIKQLTVNTDKSALIDSISESSLDSVAEAAVDSSQQSRITEGAVKTIDRSNKPFLCIIIVCLLLGLIVWIATYAVHKYFS